MMHHHLHLLPTLIFTILTATATATATTNNRRLLHQPFFFPFDQAIPPTATISEPPSTSPSPQPKYPFSTLPSPPHTDTTTSQNPFFPFFPSPPPPPTPPTTTTAAIFPTFPANISSLVLPSSHSSHKSLLKLISLIVSVSLFSVLLFASLLFLLLRHRHRHHHHHPLKTDSLRLFPPNTTPSHSTTTTKKPPPPLFPHHTPTPTSTSSEFLYLGTLVSSRDANDTSTTLNDAKPPPPPPPPPPSMTYQRLGSPELHPLPPLPRQHSHHTYNNTTTHLSSSEGEEQNNNNEEEEEEDDEEEFFSPRGSTGNNASPYGRKSSPPLNNFSTSNSNGNEFNKSRSLNSLNCNSPTYSISPDMNNSPSIVFNSTSPQSIESKSPDSLLSFPAPLPRFIPPPPVREPRAFAAFSPSSTDGADTRDCSPRASNFSGVGQVPPTPPPPPPARLWEAAPPTGPPELVAPSRKVVNGEKGSLGYSGSKSEEMMMTMKPKLKPLHWDKVRASSDRAMVWDQLKSSSFQLNEEMIETLFMVNSSNMNAKDGVRRQILETNQENLVLDPKKSQNIAILLRALNVTVDEVCEALIEGNTDALGTELLESLLKMGPTKEEERKLKEFKDDSPFKLGTAETFLKAVIDIPFAFKRVDAMLYIANFESEVEHLKRSFETLESACKELKSSRMFLKLLEAVLKTGNRMNVGTNRGDAHAFKLDTLLKLVDVKGKDGKTTLLHFVVQEIIRAEGARLSGVDPNPDPEKSPHSALRDEVEFKKLGLQVVSRLSGELTNVKKAAAMDSDVLSNDVAKLVSEISKISEVMKLNEEFELKDESRKFSGHMNEFLKKAEAKMVDIQTKEGMALSMVKGLTEYFHGDSGKEEAHHLRVFTVVRDFLGILDQVCKDVGKINERRMVNSGRQIQVPANPSGFGERQQCSSSDDETPSSSS